MVNKSVNVLKLIEKPIKIIPIWRGIEPTFEINTLRLSLIKNPSIKPKLKEIIGFWKKATNISETEIIEKINKIGLINKYIENKKINKTIYVKERLINIIVK